MTTPYSIEARATLTVEQQAQARSLAATCNQLEGLDLKVATDFPTSELGDGVHPNQAGYARMAGVWYEAIEPYLP